MIINNLKLSKLLAAVNWQTVAEETEKRAEESCPGFAFIDVVTGAIRYGETGSEIDGLALLTVTTEEYSGDSRFELASWVEKCLKPREFIAIEDALHGYFGTTPDYNDPMHWGNRT